MKMNKTTDIDNKFVSEIRQIMPEYGSGLPFALWKDRLRK